MDDRVPTSFSTIPTLAMSGGMQPYRVGIPMHIVQPDTIQSQQLQVTHPQDQPHHHQAQVAVINHGQPETSSKPKKRKKQSSEHSDGSSGQQHTVSKKKRSPHSQTHDMEDIDSTDIPTVKRSKRKRGIPRRVVQAGMHSKTVQTEQSKEEFMVELNQIIRSKLKEHVDTMEIHQLKAALHRIAELQPGLVFDVVVGQLAIRKKEKDRKDVKEAKAAEKVTFSEISMKRNGKGYIINDHLYESNKMDKKREKMYLRCQKHKLGCKASAIIIKNAATLVQRNHNHDPPNIIEKRFWNRAREEAARVEHRKKPVSKVYHIVKEEFLAEARNEEERKQIEANIPQFKSVEAGMRKRKSKVFPASANVSMLDMSFDALRDEIMGTGNDGIQAANNRNHDNTQEGTDTDIVEVNFNQFSQCTEMEENDTSSNIQTNIATTSQDGLPASSDYQSSMQIHGNEHGGMQISSESTVGRNAAAVHSLLSL